MLLILLIGGGVQMNCSSTGLGASHCGVACVPQVALAGVQAVMAQAGTICPNVAFVLPVENTPVPWIAPVQERPPPSLV